jgi:hypothetical protein
MRCTGLISVKDLDFCLPPELPVKLHLQRSGLWFLCLFKLFQTLPANQLKDLRPHLRCIEMAKTSLLGIAFRVNFPLL